MREKVRSTCSLAGSLTQGTCLLTSRSPPALAAQRAPPNGPHHPLKLSSQGRPPYLGGRREAGGGRRVPGRLDGRLGDGGMTDPAAGGAGGERRGCLRERQTCPHQETTGWA